MLALKPIELDEAVMGVNYIYATNTQNVEIGMGSLYIYTGDILMYDPYRNAKYRLEDIAELWELVKE